MALTTQQKLKKKELHGRLRAFLATNRISIKDASRILGEKPGTFQVCLNQDRYSNEKVAGFLEKIQEAELVAE